MALDKKRAEKLKKLCANLNKDKDGCDVFFIGDNEDRVTQRFSSGHPLFDWALGGGYPKGRFIELFGPESSGKTTAVLHAIAEYQKKFPDDLIAFVDSEHALDSEYAKALGVEVDSLLVLNPTRGETAIDKIRELIKEDVKLIVVDSMAALIPEAIMDGKMSDDHVARHARMMTRAMGVLSQDASTAGVTILDRKSVV